MARWLWRELDKFVCRLCRTAVTTEKAHGTVDRVRGEVLGLTAEGAIPFGKSLLTNVNEMCKSLRSFTRIF